MEISNTKIQQIITLFIILLIQFSPFVLTSQDEVQETKSSIRNPISRQYHQVVTTYRYNPSPHEANQPHLHSWSVNTRSTHTWTVPINSGQPDRDEHLKQLQNMIQNQNANEQSNQDQNPMPKPNPTDLSKQPQNQEHNPTDQPKQPQNMITISNPSQEPKQPQNTISNPTEQPKQSQNSIPNVNPSHEPKQPQNPSPIEKPKQPQNPFPNPIEKPKQPKNPSPSPIEQPKQPQIQKPSPSPTEQPKQPQIQKSNPSPPQQPKQSQNPSPTPTEQPKHPQIQKPSPSPTQQPKQPQNPSPTPTEQPKQPQIQKPHPSPPQHPKTQIPSQQSPSPSPHPSKKPDTHPHKSPFHPHKLPHPNPFKNHNHHHETDLPPKCSHSEVEQILKVHNQARVHESEPVYIWDEELADFARHWAKKRIHDCKAIHSYGPYGENIFWGLYDHWTIPKAVQSWINEEKDYDKNTFVCQPGKLCGHYTQVVWRDSTKVGCARLKCAHGLGYFITCNYDPPGNYPNENPFESHNDKY